MMILEGKPFKGRELENLKQFLREMGLEYDGQIEYTVCVLDEAYRIIGTGSVDQNVIKCVAVDPKCQGQGVSAEILSRLIEYEFERARTHLFLYTKPGNRDLFGDMGFYPILETAEILLMENRERGFREFIKTLQKETPEEAGKEGCSVGAVVANCGPFTLGHRYLLEQALLRCDYLHLFILSEDRGAFRAKERYEMVQAGIRGLDRVILHRTSDYMISPATFPTYFFKDSARGEQANCRLDLELFAKRIAPELHITKRFVGTEPYCEVTGVYNREMKKILPLYGIRVEEIERKKRNGAWISASEVRACIDRGDWKTVRELVPESVYEYLTGQKKGG